MLHALRLYASSYLDHIQIGHPEAAVVIAVAEMMRLDNANDVILCVAEINDEL